MSRTLRAFDSISDPWELLDELGRHPQMRVRAAFYARFIAIAAHRHAGNRSSWAGLIHSLAKPGGNITGVATLESELGAKRLEHFHEAFPTATRVAVLYDPMTSATVLNEMEDGARRLKLELQVLEVRAPEDMDGAFMKATQWRAAALSVLASPFFRAQRVRIAQLAVQHRLPSMVPHRAYVEAGALLSYGPNFRDLNRRTAVYVDKILKGAKPADLPVEQPTKFELVINLKTAKALGLTIPQSLLVRADEVIQ